jgi:Tfp pilus assembly protein PilZ
MSKPKRRLGEDQRVSVDRRKFNDPNYTGPERRSGQDRRSREDRRKNKRIAFRATIKYGLEKPPTYTSFVTDLSETGICIQANKVFKPDTKLYLTVFINESSFDVEGVVRWAKKAPPGLVIISKSGMGIEFTSAVKGLLDIYKEKC